MSGWRGFRLDDAALTRYWQCGTGLLTGELVGVDVDVLHAQAAAELQHLTQARARRRPGAYRPGPEVADRLSDGDAVSQAADANFMIDGHAS